MAFYNRKQEFQILNRWWEEKRSHLVIVYGKRRVGKTALCLEFAKKKPFIYFLSDRLDINSLLLKLSKQVGEFFKDDVVTKYGIQDWEELFKYIANKKEKFVLIIDEFPYLVMAEPAIDSVFQKGWDLYLSKSPVYLILCGSSIGMMEKHVLSYRAPLFGRRSGQILLKSFSFFELYNIFPKFSFENKLLMHSIVDGTITYLDYFIGSKNILKVVEENILTKGKFLYEEVEFLLKEELREPRYYFVILQSIANGKRKLSEIINDTGLDKSRAAVYLGTLQDLFIIEREVPITEKMPHKSKKGLYRICDNFFKFWFNYVFRFKSKIEEGKSDFIIKQIKADLPVMLAENYEQFARTFIIKKIEQNYDGIGKWWDKNEEIDVVAIDTYEKNILFGEVKWTNKQVGINIYEELKEKVKKVDWFNRVRKEKYILFSKSGFTNEMQKLAKEEKVILVHKDKIIL